VKEEEERERKGDPFARRLLYVLMLVDGPQSDLPAAKNSFHDLMGMIQNECVSQGFLPILLVDEFYKYFIRNYDANRDIRPQESAIRQYVDFCK
jgi:hypothetical protein